MAHCLPLLCLCSRPGKSHTLKKLPGSQQGPASQDANASITQPSGQTWGDLQVWVCPDTGKVVDAV